jgi:outer membrane protein assembly factor BamB
LIRRHPFAAPLAVLLVLVLSGCSSLNFFGNKKSEDVKPLPLPDFTPEGTLRVAWNARVGKGTGKKRFELRPAIADGVVYAADAYGLIEARSLENGRRLWRVELPPPVESSLFERSRDDGSFLSGGLRIDRGTLYCGTIEGDVIALDAEDGGELWRSRLSSEVLAPVTPAGDRLLVMTIDGALAAISRDDGEVLWSFSTAVPRLTLRGTSPAVTEGGLVIGAFANGRVVALGLLDGAPRWEHTLSQSEGRSELDRLRDLDAPPLIDEGRVYVAGFKGPARALRMSDGSPEWEQDVASNRAPGEGFGNLYLVSTDSRVVALSARGGDLIWDDTRLLRRELTAPVPFDAYLAVGDYDGYIHLFAQADGRLLARREVDGKGIDVAPIASGDYLIVQGRSGRLSALTYERRD